MTSRPSRRNPAVSSPLTPHGTRRQAALQNAHESIIAARVKTKVWVDLSVELFVVDVCMHLLGGIFQPGSLAQAVREIGWSYRHAWGYLRRAERALQTPIVRNRAGRGMARGMELTETGHLLLERMRALRHRIDEALGPSGPTPDEVAARGQGRRRSPPSRRTVRSEVTKAR